MGAIMFFNRNASSVPSTVGPTYFSEDDLNSMEERLRSIEDEESWQFSHTKRVLSYNATSVAFWVLIFLTLCFASLNGYHGYTASGANIAGYTAVIIGFLYFNIELTIPISAHLMFWGNKGEPKLIIRLIGTIAFLLGVAFSLLIIQGKFSTGADTSSARQEASAIVFGSDKERLSAAKEAASELRGRVGSRSPSSIQSEIDAILASPVGKKGETIGTRTDNCSDSRKSGRERELCAKIDQLRRMKEDAISLKEREQEIILLTDNLTDEDRTSVKTADSQDTVLSAVIGQDKETVSLFRPSIIAVVAAIVTHLLWAAHGRSVSLSIEKKRNDMLSKNKLRRAVDRKSKEVEAAALDIATKAADRTHSAMAIANVVEATPLSEQSSPIQIRAYTDNCIIKMQGTTIQIGLLHDHYVSWCRLNNVLPVAIDRFDRVLKDLGYIVDAEGRVLGVSLKV